MADAKDGAHDSTETRRHLEGYLEAYPGLRGRVCRILLLHLHKQGKVRVEDVYRRAERAEESWTAKDPNRPAPRLWAADEKELINGIVIELAVQHLSPDEVDQVVWAAHRRDEAQSLETLARMPDVPLELVAEKVAQYTSLARKSGGRAPEGTLVALIRRFISNRVDYISVAKRCLTANDIHWMLDRVIAGDTHNGYIGGKAAGMMLAAAILRTADVGEVHLPPSIFVLSDAYDEFKRVNGLLELEDHKYLPIEQVRANFPAIREIFHNGEIPERVADYLRIALDRLGETPLIVRSSSLLEDSFGAAFSGIYHSLFLPNRGTLEERLAAMLSAVAEVYAGVFSPDAISYRRRHDLLDHDERMGVMVQTVVGQPRGSVHFPEMAGVAFSRNDYRWSRRIRREDGLMRLVLGLGTHAVDRVGDYARMIPLSTPTIRPEGTPEEIIVASQKQVDVVDLEGEGFTRITSATALEALGGEIGDYVSIIDQQGGLRLPVGNQVREDPKDLCVTFDRMLGRGDFPRRVRAMLKALEQAYRVPVDLEFVVDDGKFHVLQCRPLGGNRIGRSHLLGAALHQPRIARQHPLHRAHRSARLREDRHRRRPAPGRGRDRPHQRLAGGPELHPHGPRPLGQPGHPPRRPGRIRRHRARQGTARNRPCGGGLHAGALVRHPLLPGVGGGFNPLPAAVSGRSGGRVQRGLPAPLAQCVGLDLAGRRADGEVHPGHRPHRSSAGPLPESRHGRGGTGGAGLPDGSRLLTCRLLASCATIPRHR
ncbi:MAG: PEP/pyruvate-binding domain-containing protein [Planctomycetota bacterium]|jgi:hypothetical protein